MSININLRIILFFLSAIILFLAGPASASNHPELNWRVIETAHFRVLYHQGEEELAREGSRVAEEIYPRVTGYYGFEPPGKAVIVFEDTDDFASGESSYFQNEIMITATSLDLPLRGRVDWLKNVITHEFTHLVSLELADRFGPRIPLLIFSVLESGSGKSRPGVFRDLDLAGSFPVPGSITPAWYSEGAAQAGSTRFGSDSWDSYRDTFLRASWLEGKILSLDEMGIMSGKDAWEGEQVYNQGFSICRYLEERYGPDILQKLAREQGQGWHLTFGNTIKKITGRDLPAVYTEWRDWLSAGYGKELEGIAEKETAGEKFAGKGKLNLSARFSPDGEWLAYVSSGKSDFLTESLFITPREKGGGAILLAGGVNSGASFSPDGESLIYSREDLFGWEGNHFSDLYVYDLAERSEMQITDGLRAFDPAWSPDGTKIAFINNEGGNRNVWLLDLTRDQDDLAQLTAFTGGSQVFSPVFSPAGDRIAFGILAGGNEEIYSVDLSGKVQPLVSGPANERDPAWVDERHLLYSSDEGGIFNLYLRDLGSGESRQLTRVKTGAFMPAPDPQGEGIVYSYFTAEGYRIYQLPAAISKEQRAASGPLGPTARRGSQAEVSKEQGAGGQVNKNDPPPVIGFNSSVTNPQSAIRNPHSEFLDHPYRFSLLPVSVFPELIYEDYQGFKGGAILSASDLLEKQSISAEVLFGQSQDYTVQYLNRMWHPTFYLDGGYYVRRIQWQQKLKGIKYSEDRDTNWGNLEVGPQYIFWDSLLASPFYRLRILRSKGTEQYYDSGQLFEGQFDPLKQQRQQAGLILWFMQNSPTKDGDVHPRGGRSILLLYGAGFSNFNREVQDVIEVNGQELSKTYKNYNFHEWFFNWTENFPLPLESALEAGLSLGYISRDVYFWDEFFAGGSMEFTGMGEFRTQSDFPGFPAFYLRGEQLGILHLSYRLPVLGIKRQVGFFYFNRVYFSVFGDAGNVVRSTQGFLDNNGIAQPNQSIENLVNPFRNIKADLGCELRISSNIFYSYPWGTFLRLAHGFPDPEKAPVRVYVGIGTGF